MRKTPLRRASKKRKQLSAREEREFRYFVRERDVFCVMCGEAGFPIHHIKNRQYTKLLTDPLNGLLLCDDCHSWFHDQPEQARQWIQDNRPEQWTYLQKKIRGE